jgi:hypothetical protein
MVDTERRMREVLSAETLVDFAGGVDIEAPRCYGEKLVRWTGGRRPPMSCVVLDIADHVETDELRTQENKTGRLCYQDHSAAEKAERVPPLPVIIGRSKIGTMPNS